MGIQIFGKHFVGATFFGPNILWVKKMMVTKKLVKNLGQQIVGQKIWWSKQLDKKNVGQQIFVN